MPTTLPERSVESREYQAVVASVARLERFIEIARRRKQPRGRVLAARREWWRINRRVRMLDRSR